MRTVLAAAALLLLVSFAGGALAAEAGAEADPGYATARPALAPLPRETAVATILIGAFLLFIGKKLYRIALVLVGAVLGGHAARLGALLTDQAHNAFLFSLVGSVAGAVITVPLEFVLRMLIGAIAGMVALPLLVSAATTSTPLVILAAFAGLLIGAATTYLFRRAVLIVAFALIGAGVAAIGVASLRAGPGAELILSGPEVLGMMLATAVGISFQYALEAPEEPEEEEEE